MVHSLGFYKSLEDWTFHASKIIRALRVPYGQMTERKLSMVHKILLKHTWTVHEIAVVITQLSFRAIHHLTPQTCKV